MYNYVVTLRCIDAPGIVRAASSAIVALKGNILENDQFSDPTTGEFCMRTRFETSINDLETVRGELGGSLSTFSPELSVRAETTRRRALIMVSSADHCLAELLYRREQDELALDIVAVVSNHPNCEALATRHRVPFVEIAVTPATKADAEVQLRALIERYDVDFVVLARYMQVLSSEFCADFRGRVINIHHSFLPGFKGARAYHQAYDRGVKLIGATAHFITPDLDDGPIIDQDVIRVSHSRVAEDLASLGRDVERSVLARAVKLIAEDRVFIVGSRTVIFAQ